MMDHQAAYPLLRRRSSLQLVLHGPHGRTSRALALLTRLWQAKPNACYGGASRASASGL
jgi:hypothetical protein